VSATWTVIGLLAASQAAMLAIVITIGNGLGNRIDALGISLGSRIDALGNSLGSRIDGLNARVDRLSESFVRHTHHDT